VALDPCASAANLALMRALVAAGRSEAAVHCARTYALTIREEYGLEPDPAVLACSESIVRCRRGGAGTVGNLAP